MALLMHLYRMTWHPWTPLYLQEGPCRAANLHAWASTYVQGGVCVCACHGKYVLQVSSRVGFWLSSSQRGFLLKLMGSTWAEFLHRSGRWNKILKVARWKFMPVLALLSGKCDTGACRVLREVGWSYSQVPQGTVALLHYLIAPLDLCQC